MTAAAVQRRTLSTLTTTQVLGGVGVASGVAVGGLLAADLQGSATAAGLAQTCSTIGGALLALPMSRLMLRRGRRPGLAAGYTTALVGATFAVTAAATSTLWLLFVGMALFGAGTASNLQARYAATDLAEPAHRSRALATVVWATTIGAATGPNLADPGADVADAIGLPRLGGPFLFSMVAFGLAGLVVFALMRPDPLLVARARRDGQQAGRRAPKLPVRAALALVWRTHAGRVGLTAVVVSHTVMIGVMVMTPVHMGAHGATLRVVGFVISGHVVGMYAFSPLVGMLADWAGRRTVVLTGALLLLLAVTVAGTAPGHGSVQLGIGLFLLGLGWSCGLVAGSTLVTEAVPVEARPGAQGATDMVMGVCAGLGGLLAGPVVAGPGYGILNAGAAIVVIPLLLLVATWTDGDRPPSVGQQPGSPLAEVASDQ